MYYIHKDIISRLSTPLHRLVNGSMPEALVERVVWSDISVETFRRFAQYAYTSDYDDADFAVL